MLRTKLTRTINSGQILYFQGKLWNVRISNNPALYDYTIISEDGAILFLDKVRFNTTDPFAHRYRVCDIANRYVTCLLPFQFVVKI